jgi:hypothetical protein
MLKSLINKSIFIAICAFGITLGAQVVINRNGSTGGSGSGVPAGSDTYVQFNDNGIFGGDSGLVYNKTTDILTIASTLILNSTGVSLSADSNGVLTFVGLAAGSNENLIIDFNLTDHIGISSSTAEMLSIDPADVIFYLSLTLIDPTSSFFQVLISNTIDGTSPVGFSSINLDLQNYFNGTENILEIILIDGEIFSSGNSMTADESIGIRLKTRITDSITITNAYGIKILTPTDTSSGVYTNYYGIFLQNQTIAGSTINNAFFYDGPTTSDFTVTAAGVMNLGSAGISFTQDGDGALTLKSLSAGSAEDLTINLDDTADTGVYSSSTGLNKLIFTSISLQPAGYNSSDGSVGCTGTSTAVKDGIATSCVEPGSDNDPFLIIKKLEARIIELERLIVK